MTLARTLGPLPTRRVRKRRKKEKAIISSAESTGLERKKVEQKAEKTSPASCIALHLSAV